MAKVKVATAWLDCCSGCHMSLLDIDEAIIDLAAVLELTATPITDIKEFPDVDVGIIEGAVSNEHDEHVARDLRAHCKILMVFGDCACFGGIVSMRNLFTTEEILDRYYHTEGTICDNIPSSEDLPPLTKVRPINEVVKVDCYVPGCPPSSKAILYALSELLEGRIPVVPSDIMRFD
ncbi:MAG: NADP oxidoreductase [Chloroflexota bacterium]|nr:NADP oxidoreductase [Chloroflexota bacterium]